MDIRKLREKNMKRLAGEMEENVAVVVPITPKMIDADPEYAWTIIALATKLKPKSKELAHPHLLKEEIVAEVAIKKSKAEKEAISRTNKKTMREMYSLHNKVAKLAIGDYDEDYAEYFEELLNDVNAYAIMCVADMYEADPELFEKVYEIQVAEKEQQAKNMAKARKSK